MSLLEQAIAEQKQGIVNELEARIWQRLEPRIQQELHARIMTVKEASQYLHVSAQTVRRLISSQELKHFRIRNQLFVRQIDVDEWIETQISNET